MEKKKVTKAASSFINFFVKKANNEQASWILLSLSFSCLTYFHLITSFTALLNSFYN
jgi:hypothetical protein